MKNYSLRAWRRHRNHKVTASGRGRLKVDLEPSTWQRRQEYKATYNKVESKKKGKRPVVQKDSDYEDSVCAKKKRKGNNPEDNKIVAYQPEAEAKVVEVKAKTNDRKAINARMSPRNLKRVLDSLTTLQ
ncbi:hypothetical protein Tco_1014294 [Tanacetum coccineum]